MPVKDKMVIGVIPDIEGPDHVLGSTRGKRQQGLRPNFEVWASSEDGCEGLMEAACFQLKEWVLPHHPAAWEATR